MIDYFVISMGNIELEYTENSKVLGIYIDKDCNWKKQVADTRKKAWYAWKNIKGLCSKYHGLKMSTIVNLIKISVIPIIFYAAPAWLSQRRLEDFHDIWYDMLKTVTGSSCKPSLQKLEIISSLTPLEIQLKTITTKFFIKNFMLHEEDLLTKTIDELRPDHRSIVHLHCNYVKEYFAIMDPEAPKTSSSKITCSRGKAGTPKHLCGTIASTCGKDKPTCGTTQENLDSSSPIAPSKHRAQGPRKSTY